MNLGLGLCLVLNYWGLVMNHKLTICPPGPEPTRYTASCAEMGRLLQNGADLVIDQIRYERVMPQPMTVAPIEDLLSALGDNKE